MNVLAANRSLSASHDQEKDMNRFGNVLKPLMWTMALALAAFVAACGGGGDSSPGPAPAPKPVSAAGAVCSGADCVDLASAGSFTILTRTGITNVPTSAITGNIGTSPTTGASIGVTCAELAGTGIAKGKIFDADAAYAGGGAADLSCLTTDAALLTTAAGTGGTGDMVAAYNFAAGQTATSADTTNVGAGTLTDLTLAPGVYEWGSAVTIPTNLTLNGNASAVWIFKVAGTLDMAANKSVILKGGAKPKNIFWAVAGATTIGAGTAFKGVILSPSAITLQTGATLNGRLLSGTAVALDQNTIVRPVP
jgi:hypothetical protein